MPWRPSTFAARSEVSAGEVTAEALNPLAISHTARTISCRPIGAFRAIWTGDIEPVTPNRTSRAATAPKTTPPTPQAANHRGTSRV